MSEFQQSQTNQVPPQDKGVEAEYSRASSKHAEVQNVANRILEQEVLEKGGYADQLHPPASREVVRRRNESRHDWRVKTRQQKRWWPQERLDIASREQAFFQKVYTQTMATARQHDGPIRLMFDVDQTISDFVDNYTGPEIRIIRPAFSLVVEMLREELGDRLQIGLLTTLPPTEVKDECLADIDPNAIAEELLIGTRLYAKENPDLMLQEINRGAMPQETVLDNLSDILRPDVIEAVKSGKLPLSAVRDADGKLEVIRNLHHQNPDAKFVFVDNLTPAGMIRSDFVDGVHVGLEMQDSMFAKNRNLLEERMTSAGLALAV